MSLYKDASLVMIPSAYKDGKLYSIRPTDGSGDFTFSRGSNLAATRVDVNGLIEKGRENLLTYSNDFSNADWAKTGIASVSGGQVGYDGSNDAYLITSNTSAVNHYLRQSASTQSGVQTYSIYAKGNGYDVQLRATGVGSTTNWVSFNLVSGSVGTSGAGIIESKMTSLGNGWYRCSAAFNDSGSPFVGIYMVEDADTAGSGPSYTGDGISGIFLQDAQVEQGLVATDYIETTTTSVSAGILEDMPRLDYSGGASCPSLLLEPQRTNVLPSSEYWGTWNTGTNNSYESNVTTSPEGLQNASRLYSTGGNGINNHRVVSSLSVGSTYTFSTYLKKHTRNDVEIYIYSIAIGNFISRASINFDAGTISDLNGSGSTIEDAGNGWYRCTIKAVCDGSLSFGIYTISGDTSVYAYGAQAEAGSYPTSYIPTYGTSQTRSVDNMTTDFSSAIATNGSATIFFHDLGVPDVNSISSAGGLYRYEGSSGNYVSLTTEITNWRVRVQGGGGSNFYGLIGYPKTDPIKVAIVVTSTTYSIYANGSAVVENQLLTDTADFSSIDRFQSGIQEVSGVRKAVQHLVFPTALTDSECIALTTL